MGAGVAMTGILIDEGATAACEGEEVTGALVGELVIVGETTGVLTLWEQYLFESLITQFISVEIATRGIVRVCEAFEPIGKVADS